MNFRTPSHFNWTIFGQGGNHFTVTFSFPCIHIGDQESGDWMFGTPKGFRFEAPTKLRIEKDWYYWSFELQILGFGIHLTRQWTS